MIYCYLEDKSQWDMYVCVYICITYVYMCVYTHIYTHVQVSGSQGVYVIILTVIILNMGISKGSTFALFYLYFPVFLNKHV